VLNTAHLNRTAYMARQLAHEDGVAAATDAIETALQDASWPLSA